MYTPYDWQEAIGHRAQFVESKLALGTPVIAASFDAGVVMLTYRRHARKLYEIYDRLAFGAIGQQSDVEAIRLAAVEFAHQEGYQHSEEDVTLARVISVISGPVKRAFADFSAAPVVAQSLFAEVCSLPEDDRYAVLEYDGDFITSRRFAVVAPDQGTLEALSERLDKFETKGVAVEKGIREMWRTVILAGKPQEGSELFDDLTLETALLDRHPKGEVRFRHLGDLQ
jgi:proteasome alpha subunit